MNIKIAYIIAILTLALLAAAAVLLLKWPDAGVWQIKSTIIITAWLHGISWGYIWGVRKKLTWL